MLAALPQDDPPADRPSVPLLTRAARRTPASRSRVRADGVRVLTAVAPPPGPAHDDPALEGELVWGGPDCAQPECSCQGSFHGAASHGSCRIAVVTELTGASRQGVLGALVDAMRDHGVQHDRARTDAEHLLALALAAPAGTYYRRQWGLVLPFPPGTTLDGSGGLVTPRPGPDR